ncbi:MAG TPA: tetratricopeptide repeat protein [Pyrinomonadaceae bacterium]|nr:tetratricopeptide repeat protein [Pyrinomonadaceae bacterium]
MNARTNFAPLRLCGRIFLLILALTSTIYSQTDLTNLEESVRAQITAAQAALASLAKNPATTKTALSEAYGKLGQLYHAYSLISAARDSYQHANQLAPNDFRWIYLLGKLDHQEGRFDDAIRRYQTARTLRPDYVATLVNPGNIFLELNRLEDAKESFSAALAIDKNNPAAHYGLGQVALSKRSYAEAIDHFKSTLAQVPGANRVHYSLAMAYRGLGDAEKAKAHLAQQGSVGVRVADPLVDGLQQLITGERVYLARGKVAFDARRYADAVTEFRKAVASKPDSVIARINLGAALTQAGDVNGAIEQFEAALKIEPGTVNAHYNLAVLLAGQNKHEQAITHLRSVLKVEENDLNARLLLAQELKNSAQLYESLVENARVAYLLAASPETDSRNGARALEIAQRLFNATSAAQHGAIVALALAELGRCSEAADWQRRMIATAEQNGNTDLLGKLRAGLKQFENAQSCRPANETSLREILFK